MPSNAGSSHSKSESASPTPPSGPADNLETRKGQPGSNPTFPNGFKDVHEMAAAAEALTTFGEDGMRTAERSG
jgi:hypothetical protein